MTGELIARFTVPGRPVAKARPRIALGRRSARAYTPRETLEYERAVGWAAREAYRGEPVEGPVELRMVVYVRRRGRGDLSNYVKSVEDGLNGIVWVDDRQVRRIEARLARAGKAADERVEVEVRLLGGEEEESA
ncbi:MAG: RusA family crossover junction endodeoxyribonuclease [Bacillota bacterium]|nr:RusA family crossover junction endodeoxyribonuclease [Bacillota bacterium]